MHLSLLGESVDSAWGLDSKCDWLWLKERETWRCTNCLHCKLVQFEISEVYKSKHTPLPLVCCPEAQLLPDQLWRVLFLSYFFSFLLIKNSRYRWVAWWRCHVLSVGIPGVMHVLWPLRLTHCHSFKRNSKYPKFCCPSSLSETILCSF